MSATGQESGIARKCCPRSRTIHESVTYNEENNKASGKYPEAGEKFINLRYNYAVSFSSVNRWEGGRAKPNLVAMKNLKEFCNPHDMDFNALEEAWQQIGKED